MQTALQLVLHTQFWSSKASNRLGLSLTTLNLVLHIQSWSYKLSGGFHLSLAPSDLALQAFSRSQSWSYTFGVELSSAGLAPLVLALQTFSWSQTWSQTLGLLLQVICWSFSFNLHFASLQLVFTSVLHTWFYLASLQLFSQSCS